MYSHISHYYCPQQIMKILRIETTANYLIKGKSKRFQYGKKYGKSQEQVGIGVRTSEIILYFNSRSFELRGVQVIV